MKTFAWVALLTLCIVEGLSLLCLFCGLAFKALHLEGGDILIILSCFLFALVYFLTALVPYYKKIVSTKPAFQQVPILVLRRLLYFLLGCLVFVNLFYILDLDGKEFLRTLVLTLLLALIVVVAVVVFMDKERRFVLQWVFFRVAFFLALYFFKVGAFF
jgi:hypothetical protein